MRASIRPYAAARAAQFAPDGRPSNAMARQAAPTHLHLGAELGNVVLQQPLLHIPARQAQVRNRNSKNML